MVFPFIRRTGVFVAVVLLAWTAVDVLNPALCGLDELPFVASHNSVTSGDTEEPAKQPITPEDCFCCSHNVNFSAMVHVAMALPFYRTPPTDLVQSPLWTTIPLYHPPRLLS